MAVFRYEAHDSMAKTKRGKLDASTREEAVEILRDEGLFVMRLEPDGPEEMRTVLQDPPDTADDPAAPQKPPRIQPQIIPEGATKARDDVKKPRPLGDGLQRPVPGESKISRKATIADRAPSDEEFERRAHVAAERQITGPQSTVADSHPRENRSSSSAALGPRGQAALQARLMAISKIFRQVGEWKASGAGPQLGARTWELLEASRDKLFVGLMIEQLGHVVDVVVGEDSHPNGDDFGGR